MLNENFRDMLLALNDANVEFLLVGAPTYQVTVDDFATPGIVFQIGVPPQRIDILTTISGVQFEEAWKNRLTVEIEGIKIAVLGLQDLLLNKQSTGREKDAADIPLIKRLIG